MYAGTTLTTFSGRLVGAHQKIDRLARASLRDMLPKGKKVFPGTREILHFEGFNGPDAIKRKSPAKDEPWHFYFPFEMDSQELIGTIADHYDNLVKALRADDQVRASFEAAWLSHAVVDGLTPAHHFPYEERLSELRGGKGNKSRTTIREKLIMPGGTAIEQFKNNWGMWGPKGLLTTHGFFEWGVAAIIVPLSTKKVALTKADKEELYEYGVLDLFRRKAKEIATLGMYERYQRLGWTPQLARQVRRHLVPSIVRTVTLMWYSALLDAGLVGRAE
jgi:hypothetical protein